MLVTAESSEHLSWKWPLIPQGVAPKLTNILEKMGVELQLLSSGTVWGALKYMGCQLGHLSKAEMILLDLKGYDANRMK